MPHMEINNKVPDIPSSKSESSITITKKRTLILVQIKVSVKMQKCSKPIQSYTLQQEIR